MIENYVRYLTFLDIELKKFFESQKPYIKCKKGCAECCKNAMFPYSALEMRYLMEGLMKLDSEIQDKISLKIKAILEEKKKFNGKKFHYDCPFLIDDVCSVYEYRGILCRAFGLMTYMKDGKVKAPFCAFNGLSYSNVVDAETGQVSPEKYVALGRPQEPLAFNVDYVFLTDNNTETAFDKKYGDKKPLIEWFEKQEN